MGKDQNTNIRGSYRMPAVTFGGGLMLATGAEYFGGDHWLVFVAFFSGILIVIFGVLWGIAEWIVVRRHKRNAAERLNSPSIATELETKSLYVGDLHAVCSIRARNNGPSLEGKCLAQVEGHNVVGVSDPFPIRTESQILDGRSGRFTLSHGQPKLIPIIFRTPRTANLHMFIDERGKQYRFSGSVDFTISVYGHEPATRARVRFIVEEGSSRKITMEAL